MKALIIFAHPNPQSFNSAVCQKVKEVLESKNAEIKIKDLYQMNFNSNLSVADLQQLYNGQVPPDIAAEQEDVRWADFLIFVYPIWWFERPAMLKGWFDRVFSTNFAYRYTEQGAIEGLLGGKQAAVITTSGASRENMEANGVDKSIQTNMIKGSLEFCGIQAKHLNLYEVPRVSDEDRTQMLKFVEDFIKGF